MQSAQAALTVAWYDYDSAKNSDLDAAVRSYQIHFQWNADQHQELEKNGSNQDRLEDAWNDRAAAEADFNDILQQANMEQLDVWNQVDQAQNRAYQSQESLELLQSGPATVTVMRAELKANQVALALEEAQADLEAA